MNDNKKVVFFKEEAKKWLEKTEEQNRNGLKILRINLTPANQREEERERKRILKILWPMFY